MAAYVTEPLRDKQFRQFGGLSWAVLEDQPTFALQVR
jgi:hypothetical protein